MVTWLPDWVALPLYVPPMVTPAGRSNSSVHPVTAAPDAFLITNLSCHHEPLSIAVKVAVRPGVAWAGAVGATTRTPAASRRAASKRAFRDMVLLRWVGSYQRISEGKWTRPSRQ
jgi:hypothetical protein